MISLLHRYRTGLLLTLALLLIAGVRMEAQLSVINGTTNFDTTLCGTRKCRPMVFKNSGAAPLTINSVDAFFGTFELDPTTPFNFPQTLQPNDSLLFLVCYMPTVAPRLDTFKGRIRYDVNSLDSFQLVGRGVVPNMSATPPTLTFGTVQIFGTTCLPVTITNNGDAPLQLNPVAGVAPPFSIQTPPPAIIAPGSSGSMIVCFTPIAEGAETGTATLSYLACGAPRTVDIQLNGTGALPPKVGLGPVLQITQDPTDFDTTLCGTTKCRTLTLRNLGNAPLTISQMDQINAPFSINGSTPIAIPLTLQPNQTQTAQLCYAPGTAPSLDSQRVAFVADNRVSLSISMVFDTSGSMAAATGSGVRRIDAANAGGRVFLNNLLNDPVRGIVDEAQVIRFSSAVVVAQGFTTNTAVLANAVPKTPGGGTRLYDAMDRAITELEVRSQPGRRVIVLLSDGDDDGGFLQARIDAIVARAQNNVRIFTIGLGSGLTATGISTLQQLANRTSGVSFFTNDPDTLIRIYQTIAQDLSRSVPGSFLLKGRSVAPLMTITPATVNLDSVRIGQNRCTQITIGNSGDADLQLTALPPSVNGFTITGSNPLPTIPPNGTATFNVCFAPTRLRVRDTSMLFTYSSCRGPVTLNLRGVGYDSVVIAVRDSIVGKPGSEVEVPVYIIDRIPADYGVTSITLTLSYNKTLLFPLDPPVSTDGTAGAPLTTFVASTIFEPGDSSAITSYSMTGGPVVNTTPDSRLALLRFRALLGNSISTPLRVTGAVMADGNPKVGIISPGNFRIDSLCYLPQVLLDASSRINGTLKLAVRNDANIAVLQYSAEVPGPVSVTLHNAMGREVMRVDEEGSGRGTHQITLDISQLETGFYVARLRSGNSTDGTVIVIHR